MPADGSQTVDVLRYETPRGDSHRSIESGRGEEVVAAHGREVRKRRQLRWAVLALVTLVVVGYGAFTSRLLVGAIAGVIILGAAYWQTRDLDEGAVPEVVDRNMYLDRAESEYDLDARPE